MIKEEGSFEEAKDYSLKERASADSVGSVKDVNDFAANFSIKSEFEREQDNISGEYFSLAVTVLNKKNHFIIWSLETLFTYL